MVRTYRISTEEWQAGSFQTCARCGCAIRNVTEIDGTPYGAKCAEHVLATMKPVVKQSPVIADIQNTAISPFRKSLLIAERQTQIISEVQNLSDVFKRPGFIAVVLQRPYALVQQQANELSARGSVVGKGYAMLLEIHPQRSA